MPGGLGVRWRAGLGAWGVLPGPLGDPRQAGRLSEPLGVSCVSSCSLANGGDRVVLSRNQGGDKELRCVSVQIPSGFYLLWGPHLGKGQRQSLVEQEGGEEGEPGAASQCFLCLPCVGRLDAPGLWEPLRRLSRESQQPGSGGHSSHSSARVAATPPGDASQHRYSAAQWAPVTCAGAFTWQGHCRGERAWMEHPSLPSSPPS